MQRRLVRLNLYFINTDFFFRCVNFPWKFVFASFSPLNLVFSFFFFCKLCLLFLLYSVSWAGVFFSLGFFLGNSLDSCRLKFSHQNEEMILFALIFIQLFFYFYFKISIQLFSVCYVIELLTFFISLNVIENIVKNLFTFMQNISNG